MNTQNFGLEKVTPFKYGNFWYLFVKFLGCNWIVFHPSPPKKTKQRGSNASWSLLNCFPRLGIKKVSPTAPMTRWHVLRQNILRLGELTLLKFNIEPENQLEKQIPNWKTPFSGSILDFGGANLFSMTGKTHQNIGFRQSLRIFPMPVFFFVRHFFRCRNRKLAK